MGFRDHRLRLRELRFTYLGALAAARATGLVPVPVPTDANGVLPDALAACFARTGARLFYGQPTHANPSGACLSLARHAEVLAVAAAASAFVVEDDAARDLTFDGDAPAPLVSMAPEHVVYVRSLTKSTAPGLRIAGVIARGPVRARLRASLATGEAFVSGALQRTALELVSAPGWKRHLRGLVTELRVRREAARAVVATLHGARCEHVARGGYTLWARFDDDGFDVDAFAERAAHAGVDVVSGSAWFAAEPPGAFLRVTYFGASAVDIGIAGARLAELVEPQRRRSPKGPGPRRPTSA